MPGLPLDKDEPVFDEPWQAQAFAMAVKLNEQGAFTWTEWADVLGQVIRDDPDAPYYASWLTALERIVETKDLMTRPERLQRIEDWDRAAHATPHGQPIELHGPKTQS